jgi:PPOX class probable FMN-dependent enzyme
MAHEIRSAEALRALLGDPVHPLVLAKSTPVITAPLARFIELSPFVCLATYGEDGTCDVSPRGDPPGFVKVVDEKTLFLPERPDNKRLDSILNIIHTSRLALLFLIPGTLETVRVNGTGVVTTDPDLLGRSAVNGKVPEFGVLINVEEALGHCSKAFRRSKLWQDDFVARAGVPTLAEMMSGHLQMDPALAAQLDEGIENDVKTRMY